MITVLPEISTPAATVAIQLLNEFPSGSGC